MPENNNIMSVEGQLIGMPLAGPESFSQAQLDYLKRALGVDETVLYDIGTASPTQITSDTDFNLSESFLNFTKIRVDYANSYGTGVLSGDAGTSRQLIEGPVVSTGLEMDVYGSTPASPNANSMFDCNCFVFNPSYPSKLTVKSMNKRRNMSDSTISGQSSRGVKLYRVIGVGRIAGGN
jgi:hypothetical protein